MPLSRYAAETLREVLFRFPDWGKLVLAEHRYSPDFLLEVPAPPGSGAGSLQLFTEGGERWVLLTNAGPEFPIRDSEFVPLVESIVQDRVGVAVCTSEEGWEWSEWVQPGEHPPHGERESVRIVSWLGSLDASY